jgi:hypothetical protein
MKTYQAFRKVFIDPIYLKPAMSLGRFCPTVNNLVTMVALITMVTSDKDGM